MGLPEGEVGGRGGAVRAAGADTSGAAGGSDGGSAVGRGATGGVGSRRTGTALPDDEITRRGVEG